MKYISERPYKRATNAFSRYGYFGGYKISGVIYMKYRFILVVLFVIICISLLFSSQAESFQSIKVDIGNEVGHYFYKLGLCILQKKDFEYLRNVTGEKLDMGEHFFFQSFPTFLKYDYDEIHDNLNANGITEENVHDKMGHIIHGLSSHEMANDTRYNFWICMKPLVQKILNDAFEKSGLTRTVPNPIIHFRCSDTPFLRYEGYHLQAYSFFKKALEVIADKIKQPIKTVDIVSFVSHKSGESEQKSCNIYLNALRDYLVGEGYNVNLGDNSNIDDFASLFYAPAVISTGSSFSFMSGFFGKGVFITTELDAGKLCNACSDITLYEYNLPHTLVKDYHDTDTVIELLRQPSFPHSS